jgi:hypothetical protein
MCPISQRLTIHAANLHRFRAAHAVIGRRQGQKPPNLARIATAFSKASKPSAVVVVPKKMHADMANLLRQS